MNASQLALTVDPLADAIAWKRRNSDAWNLIVDWAHRDHNSGAQVSTRTYVAVLRRPWLAELVGLKRMPGDPVLLNDHISAGLARLLRRQYPYLNIPTRKAVADGWGAP